MSVRGIIISLAANFVVAGTVWYLRGPNAGLICLAIGGLLLIVALLWPKKSPAQPPPPPTIHQENKRTAEANPPQNFPPINISLSNIGNPRVSQEQHAFTE